MVQIYIDNDEVEKSLADQTEELLTDCYTTHVDSACGKRVYENLYRDVSDIPSELNNVDHQTSDTYMKPIQTSDGFKSFFSMTE